MNLLLFGARRRVYFLNKLKEIKKYYKALKLFYSDTDHLDPMCYLADEFFLLPKIEDPDFWDQFDFHTKKNKIKALIAWNDKDILYLSANRSHIEESHIKICLPPHYYVDLFCNKLKTAYWCLTNGINHPYLYTAQSLKDIDENRFPIISKPIYGQGSIGIRKIMSDLDLHSINPNNLYQEFIEGEEYTVDIWLDSLGNPTFIAPRKRLKTRGGEVLISQIDMDSSVINFCERVCSFLTFEGVFNIQVIKNKKGIFLIEFNPRIGGGTDLTVEAGANIPLMIVNYIHNKDLSYPKQNLKDGLLMSRYFESVFYKLPVS